MDIRTKLVFALVLASIGSMAVLGWAAYAAAGGLLRNGARNQLEALAESKRDDLQRVTVAWRDRVNLIASRTQLRNVLRDYNQTGASRDRSVMLRILEDARSSVEAVETITLFDIRGNVAAAVGDHPGLVDSTRTLDPASFGAGTDAAFRGVSSSGDVPLVTLVAPMELEAERIGAVEVVLDAMELIAATQDYTGLGRTGETLVIQRTPAGVARVLNPTRHSGPVEEASGEAEEAVDILARTVAGTDTILFQRTRDYRGELVWAATRYLPDLELWIAVKVDQEEEEEPVAELRRTLVVLGLSLSSFAIVLGTLLGLWIARPIHDLATVAKRIRNGELDARADARSEDEIGMLAATFNEMIEQLVGEGREPSGSGSGPEQKPEDGRHSDRA